MRFFVKKNKDFLKNEQIFRDFSIKENDGNFLLFLKN